MRSHIYISTRIMRDKTAESDDEHIESTKLVLLVLLTSSLVSATLPMSLDETTIKCNQTLRHYPTFPLFFIDRQQPVKLDSGYSIL